MALGPQDLLERLQETTQEIRALQTNDYHVSHVIVINTFETENSQQTCLQALKTSCLNIMKQNTEGKSAELFRGEHVLDVERPYEPSSFRYLDLDVTYVKGIIQQSITFCITIGLLAIGGYMVTETRDSAVPVVAGILTSVLNIILLLFVNIMLLFEQHEDESEPQRSLYMKITLFHWINTAVMPRIVTVRSSYLGTDNNDLDSLFPRFSLFRCSLCWILWGEFHEFMFMLLCICILLILITSLLLFFVIVIIYYVWQKAT